MAKPGPSRFVVVSMLLVSALLAFSSSAAAGQSDTLQTEIAGSVAEQGYWDGALLLDDSAMGDVVVEFGQSFAFAYTDASYTVNEDPDRSAAALLALSTLEQLGRAGGPATILFVTEDDASGASNEFPFVNIVEALSDFDRSNPEASFARAAEVISGFGSEIDPQLTAQLAQSGDAGFFSGIGPFIILAIITAVLASLAVRSSKKKKSRKAHTAPARDSTAMELQEMSDLIIDLDPRVSIANDADLKARYVDASDTYRDVLEKFQAATTGHEIADLRIDIAKARWKLDVVDAELEGEEPPQEPFTRDNSGSAWDSTRGRGSE